MKLGVLTVATYDKSLEDAAEYLSSLGVQALEIGAGGCPGNTHLNPDDYLDNPAKIQEFKDMLKKYTVQIFLNIFRPSHKLWAKKRTDTIYRIIKN